VPSVQLAEIELHYVERGSGRPLLLVPGIPAIASDWAPLAERLARSRRVIAYDNRGSGASGVTPAPYSCVQLAADAVALLDALEIERADVFGMSLGGMIAQELALGWPDRVERLVLGCTHCGLEHAARPDREAGQAFAMETDDWAQRMRALDRSRSPTALGPSCSTPSSRRRWATSSTPRATAARSRQCSPTTPTTASR